MKGGHVIQAWSVTQATVALSYGEAEYYSMVRGASHGLGMQAMLKDLGQERRLRIKTDASVAKSISSRRGIGKIKHLETNVLWLQQKVFEGKVEVIKIPRAINHSDSMTSYRNSIEIRAVIADTNQFISSEIEFGTGWMRANDPLLTISAPVSYTHLTLPTKA